jgi:hypothetical protein
MSHLTVFACTFLVLISASANDVSFQAQPPKPGQKVSITSNTEGTTTVRMTKGGQEVHKMDMPSAETVACVVTTTAVDDHGIQSANVAFSECKMMSPSPFGLLRNGWMHGLWSVEVKRADRGFIATGKLREEEETAMGRVCDSVLMAPLGSMLAGKSLKKGEIINVPIDAARQALALFASVLQVKSMTLTLDGERIESGVDVAAFKVVAKLAKLPSKEDAGDVTIDVTGEMAVSKTGLLLVSSTLTGTIKVQGSIVDGTQKMELEGSGNVTWKYSARME